MNINKNDGKITGDNIRIYITGGAVRDVLMGRIPKDIDYVVVGATPEDMIEQGFKQVGADFPVFLHPETGDEYALARTERKTGVGYNGFETIFDPSVTIGDDLCRRDLTINSMAVPVEHWKEFVKFKNTNVVIDPFCGQADMKVGLLVHVSEAFAEDPIRVLRTARFAARYGFKIQESTLELMKKVAPELNHVPHERIWAEFQKGLMEDCPELMISAMRDAGVFEIETMKPYRLADPSNIIHSDKLPVRFTSIAKGFSFEDYNRCCIPSECAKLSVVFNKYKPIIAIYDTCNPRQRLLCLMNTRLINNSPEFKEQFMDIVAATCSPSVTIQIEKDLNVVRSVDCATIAESCKRGTEIADQIFKARVDAMINIESI